MLQLDSQHLLPDRKVIPAEEYQTFLDGEGIIAAAKAEAAKILEQAKADHEAQKIEGYEQGLLEGRMEMAERMVDSVANAVDYFGSLESRIVDIVMKALRKILGDMDQRDRIVQLVQHALSVARNQAKVTLRVSKSDLETVQSRLNEIMRPYPAIQFIDVLADVRLESGGCIMETDMGVVDASIDIQLNAIEASLKKSMQSSGESNG